MWHILLICFLSMTTYIHGGHPQHLSSYPFIADFTFACFATHSNAANNIKPGDTVYINGMLVDNFFRNIHPKINAPYILITHGGWPSVPDKLEHYLDDPKIIAWFGKNIDRNHPKLHPLPIGLANKDTHCGKTDIVQKVMASAPPPHYKKNRQAYLYEHDNS